jgi:hypothetical protein
MLVKIGKLKVDVLDTKCAKRDCFVLGFNKGSFSQGRGYTSYHTDANGKRVEKPVCGTRHYGGCPSNSVCATCRTVSVEAPGGRCTKFDCTGELVARGVAP